jgi:hypothetical protein
MCFRRPSDQQALVTGTEAVLAVVSVETEPDNCRSKPAWSAAGLRRHGHLEEGLSRVECHRVVASGQGPSPPQRPPRHAILIGFSTADEQHTPRDSDAER